MRRRLTETEPVVAGAGPPYPLLRPWENVHSGRLCSPAIRTTAWTSTTVAGETTAEGMCSCQEAWA